MRRREKENLAWAIAYALTVVIVLVVIGTILV